VVLRDAAGKELWRWSNGRAFLTVIVHKAVFDLAASVEVPLDSLAPGAYAIDAWLPSTPGPPRFAASAPFRISAERQVDGVKGVIERPDGRLRQHP
jgi:hypothetical protein